MTTIPFYDTLCDVSRTLSHTFPGCISYTVFGKSHIGRDIPALRLGDTSEGSHRLLYIGGMTGSLVTSLYLLRFVRDFGDAIQKNKRVAGIDISYLHHTRSITVVPLLNPDGAVLRLLGGDSDNPLADRLSAMRAMHARAGKNPFSDLVTNGRGVDLRYNCDADFDTCVREARGVGMPGFPGMHPESEPEVAAVCRYLRAAAVTDLSLLLDDDALRAPSDPLYPAITHASNTFCGGDRRTASIASILARDIDAKHCHTGVSEKAGSFCAWYKMQNTGPMLDVYLPGGVLGGDSPLAKDGEAGPEQDVMCQLLRVAAGFDTLSATTPPGMTLYSAELALGYGKIRRALFHGTVL